MKQYAYITIGLPASGKTRWAGQLIEDRSLDTVNCWGEIARINNDDIRDRLTNGAYSAGTLKWDPKFEKLVHGAFMNDLRWNLDNKYDVVLDNTYLNPKTLNALQTFLTQNYPDVIQVIKDFRWVSVNECLERDKDRRKAGKRSVGDAVILDMWTKYILPTIPKVEVHSHRTPVIICDLDGTLSVVGNRSPFDASKCDILDTPNFAVLDLVKNYIANNYKVIFVSGRMEKDREPTLRFIKNCKISMNNPMVDLYMRQTGDTRHDWIIKKEIYESHIKDSYHVVFCVDDRPMVIRMWKEQGLTVLNVGTGQEF